MPVMNLFWNNKPILEEEIAIASRIFCKTVIDLVIQSTYMYKYN